MSGVLVGVGVGPGDPDLVTLKALRVLREADAVLVPVLSLDEPGRAETIVRAHLGDAPRVHPVVFALNDPGGLTRRRTEAWDAAAHTAVRLLTGTPPTAATAPSATGPAAVAPSAPPSASARVVAFATLGDPNLYSTFTYLARTVRDLAPGTRVATVPGITAMQDLAARSGTVLAEGDEPLTLLPLAGRRPGARARLRDALRAAGTVVAYKFGARAAAVRAELDAAGRLGDAVYGARLGLAGEHLGPAAELGETAAPPYLSTLIAPPRRTTRGGRL